MSLRFEQHQALLETKKYLQDRINPKTRPKTVAKDIERLCHCLRHFPPLSETGKPRFSEDPFTED